jgi:hypothetical protein
MQLAGQRSMTAPIIHFLPSYDLEHGFSDELSYTLSCICPYHLRLSSSPARFLLSSTRTFTLSPPSLALKANNNIRVVPTKPPNSLRNANTTQRPASSSTTPQPPPKPSAEATSRPPRPPQPAKSRFIRRGRKRHRRSHRARTDHES